MFFSLKNKSALITGGSSGIGLAIAKRFHSAGARIAIADLQDAPTEIDALDGIFIRMDVSQSDQVKAGLAQAESKMGQLDVLVNNAGINGVDGVTIEESDEELTRKLFEINVYGVYYGLKFGPAHMRNGGSIINTTSLGATMMFPGSGPYSASKASVSTLTQMSATELASRNIRVNAVAPSFVRTPLAIKDIKLFERIGELATSARRIAEPEEVAAVYHFLASDDSSYINGQIINADGGMSLGFTQAELDWLGDVGN